MYDTKPPTLDPLCESPKNRAAWKIATHAAVFICGGSVRPKYRRVCIGLGHLTWARVLLCPLSGRVGDSQLGVWQEDWEDVKAKWGWVTLASRAYWSWVQVARRRGPFRNDSHPPNDSLSPHSHTNSTFACPPILSHPHSTTTRLRSFTRRRFKLWRISTLLNFYYF